MKRTPRMQKAILQSTILNSLILLILLLIFFIVILPKVLYFESKKKELTDLYSNFSLLQKKGISFTDFKTNFSSSGQKSTYLETILKNIDNHFYQKNLQNTKNINFDIFIENLQQIIEDEKSSDLYKDRISAIQKILPVYGSLDSEGLKEKDFVNKIERTFRAFNLSSEGGVSMGNIKQYDKSENIKSRRERTSLEESIYYIPLSFDIVGKKKDVFDFLHYFEKVGSVWISENILSVHSDEKIRNPISIKTLNKKGNIYEDQVAEISSFKAKAYPDSSTFSNNEESKTLLEVVSLNQAKERYEANIVIKFYVTGLPEYSMKEYMASIIVKYQKLKKESQTTLQKAKKDSKNLSSSKQIQALNALVSINALFSTLDKNFQIFQKETKKTMDVRKTFRDAQILDNQLSLIDRRLKSAIEDLK